MSSKLHLLSENQAVAAKKYNLIRVRVEPTGNTYTPENSMITIEVVNQFTSPKGGGVVIISGK